ncbi:MAG: substrate-binding domain-containing protein, partial [Verrucomicrobiota bacterium]
YWTGFGARFRVFIVNTNRMPATEAAVAEKLKGDLSSVALAKPIYGTTLTHYSILWERLGGDNLKEQHREQVERGLKIVAGNSTVKNMVADGNCDLGFTDTDDFFLSLDDDKPTTMLPVKIAGGQTICIPNTVSIIQGTKRETEARELVDYLLSAENEVALANSRSRQVPLGPIDTESLSDDVRQMKPWVKSGYPLASILKARNECLAWLKSTR